MDPHSVINRKQYKYHLNTSAKQLRQRLCACKFSILDLQIFTIHVFEIFLFGVNSLTIVLQLATHKITNYSVKINLLHKLIAIIFGLIL